MMVLISVLGIGCGPLVMGIVSDLAATVGGLGPAEGLRWALLASPVGLLIAAPLFIAARRHVGRDIVG
jgi:hypothetical protein